MDRELMRAIAELVVQDFNSMAIPPEEGCEALLRILSASSVNFGISVELLITGLREHVERYAEFRRVIEV